MARHKYYTSPSSTFTAAAANIKVSCFATRVSVCARVAIIMFNVTEQRRRRRRPCNCARAHAARARGQIGAISATVDEREGERPLH